MGPNEIRGPGYEAGIHKKASNDMRLFFYSS